MIPTAGLIAILAAAGVSAAEPPRSPYAEEILKWREQREARLKADGGWLTVAGLFWLKEGANSFGADPECDIALPQGPAPVRAGVIEFREGKTVVKMAPGTDATVDGKPITQLELKADDPGPPDVVTMGPLTMHVIKRGERYAIRLKDMNSRFRREFTGLRWYPVNERYRITARFEPYDPPRMVRVPTVLGTTEEMPCPGAAVFTLEGKEVRVEPVLEQPADKELFLIFKDATAGKETYPSGRFLYAPMPQDGKIVLDFNKAYNPPCAFTPYATCPLPPEQNRLEVSIEAGELSYGHP
jgi:uncharacterized protein (DUF1684 family)